MSPELNDLDQAMAIDVRSPKSKAWINNFERLDHPCHQSHWKCKIVKPKFSKLPKFTTIRDTVKSDRHSLQLYTFLYRG
jgi:hypothetical protein